MKYCHLVLFTLLSLTVAAQQPNATDLRTTAKSLLQKGDLDNAIKALETAKQLEPGNIDVLKELSFAAYIKKDYARAMEVGKEAVANLQADAQAYQILGLSYKAIALYKEGEKLYKTALAKFPNDGVLYNEFGEMLALDNKVDDALVQWEKGIRSDPSYSSNYYNATLYYAQSRNWLRVAVYGELFVNIESYTKRTDGIKKQVLTAWTYLFSPGYIKTAQNARGTSDFEKSMLTVFEHVASQAATGMTADNIGKIRQQFIAEWLQSNDKKYPFRLFNHQQQLLSLGYYEAYNQWLFGEPADAGAYLVWQTSHPKETQAFKTFQEGRVFKIPLEQYYFTR